MYRLLPLGDDFIEICDQCGFDGSLIDMDQTSALLASLGDRWAAAFAHPEELLRRRPDPETWCAVEYAQHVTFAIGAIEWAAREFVAGRSPDWDQEPKDLAGQFEHDTHDCEQFEVASTLDALGAAASSIAAFAAALTPEEQDRRANYSDALLMNTAAVVRHALHDAEHHLLDIRRGVAGFRLAD